MKVSSSILDAIGNTPLVQLRKVVPSEGHARILVKLESANPTGSMKDRLTLALIEKAEQDGRLQPDGIVVENTTGSTGPALALVCAAKGYRLVLVTSDAFSRDKLDHMQALGAELIVIKAEKGLMTKKLIKEVIGTARELGAQPGYFYANQLDSPNQADGYIPMAEEIWEQTGGKVDAFLTGVGTSGSLRGTAMGLRNHNPDLLVAAVEPVESPVLSGGEPGSHRIEGIGIGFVPPRWDPGLVDEILQVSAEESIAMARQLASQEAVFAGTSTGANVVAAIKLAKRLGSDATVVTVVIDTGLKYLRSHLFIDD